MQGQAPEYERLEEQLDVQGILLAMRAEVLGVVEKGQRVATLLEAQARKAQQEKRHARGR